MPSATFALGPISPWAYTLLGVLAVLCLGLTILMGSLALTASRLSVTVEEGQLRIGAPLYGRSIPLAELKLEAARVVSTVDPSPYRPSWRRNGIGLPGYRLGWYKLHNGEKALLMLTSGERAVHIPTTGDYVLLLGVREPENLLEVLRR